MVKEVKERVELIVSVQGSRRISQQNLDFLYEKYELDPEARQQVQDFCAERGITIFDEEGAGALGDSVAAVEAAEVNAAKPAPTKKGLLARLFGR